MAKTFVLISQATALTIVYVNSRKQWEIGAKKAVPTQFLLLTASLCLVVALLQAWLLVAVFSSDDSPVLKLIPGRQDLLKSHIDYLMMAQFQFIFFMLFRTLEIIPPAWMTAFICIGSFFNPFAFFVRALRPGYLKSPPIAFTAMITLSCILTTVGYGAAAWFAAKEALSTL